MLISSVALNKQGLSSKTALEQYSEREEKKKKKNKSNSFIICFLTIFPKHKNIGQAWRVLELRHKMMMCARLLSGTLQYVNIK